MTASLLVSGVLIDMDGILLDTERVAERCWTTAEEETGFRMPPGFYHSIIGQNQVQCEQRLREAMDPACDVSAFLAVANREYRKAVTGAAIPVKRGVREFLGFLRDHAVPVCLATSTYRALADHKLKSSGLDGLIPQSVCGDEVEHSKPDPAIYRKAAGCLGLPPENLLAVEDSENGLRSAYSAGCQVTHIPDIARVTLEAQRLARRVYPDMGQLLAAVQRGEIQFAPLVAG